MTRDRPGNTHASFALHAMKECCFVPCAGIRYIQENDYPVRGTYGFY